MKIAKERLRELVENELATGQAELLTREEALKKIGAGEIVFSFIKNRSSDSLTDLNGHPYAVYEFFDKDEVLMGGTYEVDGGVHVGQVLTTREDFEESSEPPKQNCIIIKVDENDLIQE